MVDSEQMLQLFDQYFLVDGGYREFNPQTQRVDVEGDLYVQSSVRFMDQIPVPLGIVTGNVRIKDVGLQTLLNGPTRVYGNLNVAGNDLTSLAHAPQRVVKDLIAENNKIKSLDAANTVVGDDLNLRSNRLENLEGCPQVGGMLMVSRNPELMSLNGLRADTNHMIVTYNTYLPLLRLLDVQGEVILTGVPVRQLTDAFQEVIKDPQYKGKGKTVMLNVALKLKKAGFPPTNVRW